MKITLKQQELIKAHILSEFPNEACGIIANKKFIPCKNIASNPRTEFEIALKDYSAHLIEGRLQAVIHSHVSINYERLDPRTPSYADQASWMSMGNIPWLIYHTNGHEVSEPLVMDDSNPPPLLEREYIYGIQDCYSIIRDYYRMELSILLPNVPREPEFWKTGNDYYGKYFEEFGFYEVPQAEATINDLVFMQIGCDVVNHAGVITGPNILLHQLHGKFSCHDTLSKWHKQITKIVRYKGDKKC